MNTVCVFIGANVGKGSIYLEATRELGVEIAKRNIELIYGGGKLGLMGVLADTVLENGGKVTGVITKSLYENEAHLGLSRLHTIESMYERKKMMMQLADGFIALPGGLGTLEEIFEIWNASKLMLHNKPLGLLNVNNYFDRLIEFLDHVTHEEFIKNEFQKIANVVEDPRKLLDALIKK